MDEVDPLNQLAPAFFDAVEAIVGDRLVHRMHDPDGGPRVTVVGLTDADVVAITDAGRQAGIAAWVRIECAEPADLEAWQRLQADLLRLRDVEKRVLRGYPGPGGVYGRPPVRISLQGAAEAVAADLHARYGNFLDLRVGALGYPPAPLSPESWLLRVRGEPIDPTEFRVELEHAVSVRSGDSSAGSLLVTNLSVIDVEVITNGSLPVTVTDPESGDVVGGYSGNQRFVGRPFRVAASATVPIPLLVGTDSFRPELGYVVPPGTWTMTVPFEIRRGRWLVAGPLPLTIT